MHNPLLIGTFVVVVVLMLLLDLGIVNKSAKTVGNKQAALWTLIWVSLAMLFSVFVYFQLGVEKFAQFGIVQLPQENPRYRNLQIVLHRSRPGQQ